MRQVRLANASRMLVGATLGLACSGNESGESAASSPVEMNTVVSMNEPATPQSVPGEAQPSGVPPAPGQAEGQPVNVGLVPPSTEA